MRVDARVSVSVSGRFFVLAKALSEKKIRVKHTPGFFSIKVGEKDGAVLCSEPGVLRHI